MHAHLSREFALETEFDCEDAGSGYVRLSWKGEDSGQLVLPATKLPELARVALAFDGSRIQPASDSHRSVLELASRLRAGQSGLHDQDLEMAAGYLEIFVKVSSSKALQPS